MFRMVLALCLVITIADAAPRVHPVVPMLDGRIVGGEQTTIEERPYQLSLQWFDSHICGASIVTEIIAVTAAHCTYGSTPYFLTVRAGSTKHDQGGQVSKIEQIYEHPLYRPDAQDYDVSVFTLKTPLVTGLGVQPIPLHNLNAELPDGILGTVSGWGTLTQGGDSPTHLQTVDVPKVNDAVCEEAYKSTVISDRMICFGSSQGGVDSCQGDSGGPLIADGQLVGIVSWGYGCARPEYPGVYTKVANKEILKHITSLFQ